MFSFSLTMYTAVGQGKKRKKEGKGRVIKKSEPEQERKEAFF